MRTGYGTMSYVLLFVDEILYSYQSSRQGEPVGVDTVLHVSCRERDFAFAIILDKIPYSGKLSRKKTFADP